MAVNCVKYLITSYIDFYMTWKIDVLSVKPQSLNYFWLCSQFLTKSICKLSNLTNNLWEINISLKCDFRKNMISSLLLALYFITHLFYSFQLFVSITITLTFVIKNQTLLPWNINKYYTKYKRRLRPKVNKNLNFN